MDIKRIDICLQKVNEVYNELKDLKRELLEDISQPKPEPVKQMGIPKTASPQSTNDMNRKEDDFDADGGNEVTAESAVKVDTSVRESPVKAAETPSVTAQVAIDPSILEMLDKPRWPLAVPAEMICDVASEEDKAERAEGIIELIIGTDLTDKTFLDFGCGEGHCALKAKSKGAKVSVGYDIVKTDCKESDGLIFTNNWEEVVNNGPYDAIMVYDVLDHLVGEEPVAALNKIKSVMAPDSKAYIRFHPWIGRHGGHLYQKINKAFAHLVLTEEELRSLGHEVLPNLKVMRPLGNYREWLDKAGLKRVEETVSETKPEPFFAQDETVRNRLLKVNNLSKFPSFQMKMNFIDYVVTL